jgi:carbon-monoxide dehydrogenase small subunit
LQCGFCTPGFLMSILPILEENPEVSEEVLHRAVDGNLCRCTGYQNIRSAVKLAAEKMSAGGES